jgi:hypothetical protein
VKAGGRGQMPAEHRYFKAMTAEKGRMVCNQGVNDVAQFAITEQEVHDQLQKQ